MTLVTIWKHKHSPIASRKKQTEIDWNWLILTDIYGKQLYNLDLLHGDICSKILKAFYEIYTILPSGLDKEIYKNALLIELQSLGLKVELNKKISIHFKENIVGEISADFLINNFVVVNIDTKTGFIESHQIEQNKKYLKLSNFEVLLLLNFGVELDHKRLFLTNDFKKLN